MVRFFLQWQKCDGFNLISHRDTIKNRTYVSTIQFISTLNSINTINSMNPITKKAAEKNVVNVAVAVAVASALKIQAVNNERLSPEHNRFNKLLKQTETLTKKLETLRTIIDQHRVRVAQRIQPLQTHLDQYAKKVVELLDARLAQVVAQIPKKSLTPTQVKTAKAILCALANPLACKGDGVMHSLYDKHNLQTQDKAIHSRHSDMREEVQRMMENNQRKARSPTKARKKVIPSKEDADTALRTIYRQLASALHPDRAATEEERVQKTALMKEVNAAYEQRNLLGLLQLQMQADSVDAKKIAGMASEKLAGFTQLLKDRVTVLQETLYQTEQSFQTEFDLPPDLPVNDTLLMLIIGEQADELQSQIQELKQVLEAGQNNDKTFKLWLNGYAQTLYYHA
ncbi:MAG: hypothetical protein RIR79_1129 [Pseudomonadota bacterium]|jgi:hypothetical protein